MRFRITRKKTALGAAAAALVVGGVVSYAYFTATGSGSATATVGASSPWGVVVNPGTTATPSAQPDLFPGANSDTYFVTVTNNDTGHQALHQLVISIAKSDGSTWTATANPAPSGTTAPEEPNCSSADFALGGQATAGAYTISVPSAPLDLAHNGTYTTTFTVQMLDNATGQDQCQGVTPPLYVVAS